MSTPKSDTKMTEQSQTPPFKIGDKVTTDFDQRDRAIVRTVTKVAHSAHCQSGWVLDVDAGTACQRCKRDAGVALTDIDSDWFKIRTGSRRCCCEW